MAVVKNTDSISLKTTLNYGEVEGKVVTRSKSYGDVKTDATDEAIVATYEFITGMQAPVAERCQKVTTETLEKTV